MNTEHDTIIAAPATSATRTLIELFREMLDQRGVKFRKLRETLLEFKVNAKSGTYTCTIETWEHRRKLLPRTLNPL
jgi:tRNA(Met) C34 N-acetyltransferase TmcA